MKRKTIVCHLSVSFPTPKLPLQAHLLTLRNKKVDLYPIFIPLRIKFYLSIFLKRSRIPTICLANLSLRMVFLTSFI